MHFLNLKRSFIFSLYIILTIIISLFSDYNLLDVKITYILLSLFFFLSLPTFINSLLIEIKDYDKKDIKNLIPLLFSVLLLIITLILSINYNYLFPFLCLGFSILTVIFSLFSIVLLFDFLNKK